MKENIILETLKMLLSSIEEDVDPAVKKLEQSGSPRQYFRLAAGGGSFIGTYVPDPVEGECFINLSRVFTEYGRYVPVVFAASCDNRFYIQEDLGGKSLFASLSDPEVKSYIKETLRRLAVLQKTPEAEWMGFCMAKPFSRRQIMWDLNYFKYEFLRPQEIVFDEDRLEDDFLRLAGTLISIPERFQGFMMRDCQSRNVMLTERGPVFIDFQGGRKGPVLYDAVSFLWQARAGFSKEFRNEMLDFYCSEFCNGDEVDKVSMMESLDSLVLFRTLQVLGAYGFRGLIQRKAHFLLSIPGALDNLRDLMDSGALDLYPELKRCAASLFEMAGTPSDDTVNGLLVEVFSFSYKKGYPEDRSGNGGGFMFDCRALHNPGRYERYRSLTGKDDDVIRFLRDRGEVQAFLKNAWSLTDPAIETYVRRGFTHLQIGFGCTGGQHRSVYCAENTAAHIRALFPEVKVRIMHREHPELE